MNNAYVKTEYIKGLGHHAFAVMTALLLNDHETGSFNVTAPLIVATTLVGREPDDADLQAVNKGLRELIKKGLIEKYRNGFYRINYELIEREDEQFICLHKKDIQVILNSEEGLNKFSLLQYYTYLLSTFDYYTGIGCFPISYYAEGSGVHEQTIYKYHRALENLGVLKVFRFAAVPTPGGLVRRQINIYCTPDNESAAIQYLKDHGKYSHLISAEDPVDPDFGNPDLIPDEAIPEALR